MWALYSALAGVFWGTGNILDKYIMTKRITGFLTFIVLAQLLNAFFGALLLLNADLGGLMANLPRMGMIALLDIMALSTYIFALRMDDASKVIPLFDMALIFIPIGDALFLGNVLSTDQYAGIALIMLFGFLLLLDPEKGLTHSVKVFTAMFFSSLGYSSIWLIGETVIDFTGPMAFTGFMYFFRFLWVPFLVIFVHFYAKQDFSKMFENIKPYLTPRTISLLFLSNASGVFGIYLFMKALEGDGIPSMVDAMTMSQYVFIFLVPLALSKICPRHFHERVSKRIFFQKLVCITAMIAGGLLILL